MDKNLEEIKTQRRALERLAFSLYAKAIVNRRLFSLEAFREWLLFPMNYWRSVELPFTLKLLSPIIPGEKIIDVGSPKLLSLFLSFQTRAEVYATDLIDYFVPDFTCFKEVFGLSNLRIETCDARSMHYPDGSFDKLYSVSVVEHIPGEGDIEALREFARVLKPGGQLVLTVPYNQTHMNEYTDIPPYWALEAGGRCFFQRRYSHFTLRERLVPPNLKIEKQFFIAETPVKKPYVASDGKFVHNHIFIDRSPLVLFLRITGLPFIRYLVYRFYSNLYHYLAARSDPNVRNVVLQMRKQA